jgi:xanthosine utilization system XapX-like protein
MAMMSYLLTFGAGMLAGIVLVGIIINLTILNQDRWNSDETI